jgi:FtsH-binding integral membrane protein
LPVLPLSKSTKNVAELFNIGWPAAPFTANGQVLPIVENFIMPGPDLLPGFAVLMIVKTVAWLYSAETKTDSDLRLMFQRPALLASILLLAVRAFVLRFANFAKRSLSAFINSLISFFCLSVRGLLLIIKSTPSGSFMYPMIIRF